MWAYNNTFRAPFCDVSVGEIDRDVAVSVRGGITLEDNPGVIPVQLALTCEYRNRSAADGDAGNVKFQPSTRVATERRFRGFSWAAIADLEVPVVREHVCQPFPAHRLHRHTIRQAVAFYRCGRE